MKFSPERAHGWHPRGTALGFALLFSTLTGTMGCSGSSRSTRKSTPEVSRPTTRHQGRSDPEGTTRDRKRSVPRGSRNAEGVDKTGGDAAKEPVPRLTAVFKKKIPETKGTVNGMSVRGRWVAIATDTGRVVTLDAATGALRWTSRRQKQKLDHITFSADGSRLVATGHNLSNFIWKMRKGRGKFYRSWHRKHGKRQALSHDGRRLIREDHRSSIRWYELSTYKMKWLAKGKGLAISGDGKLVATFNKKGVLELRDATTGRLERKVLGIPRDARFALSPNGDTAYYILTGDKGWSLVSVDTKTQKKKYATEPRGGKIQGFVVSPDSPFAAVWGRFGVGMYSLLQGKRVVLHSIPPKHVALKGRLLYYTPSKTPNEIVCKKLEIPSGEKAPR